jgi:hypothetical protein
MIRVEVHTRGTQIFNKFFKTENDAWLYVQKRQMNRQHFSHALVFYVEEMGKVQGETYYYTYNCDGSTSKPWICLPVQSYMREFVIC